MSYREQKKARKVALIVTFLQIVILIYSFDWWLFAITCICCVPFLIYEINFTINEVHHSDILDDNF